MILADVNVLIHAFRSDSVDHTRAKPWLEDLINGREMFGVSPQVLSGVIRITTHPRIYAQPSSRSDAIGFCDALMNAPLAAIVEPSEHHWKTFVDLCETANATGNLVPDAWFAALAIDAGAEWVTFDRDYARFPGLKWRTPW